MTEPTEEQLELARSIADYHYDIDKAVRFVVTHDAKVRARSFRSGR